MNTENRVSSLLNIHAGEGRLVMMMLAFSFFLGIPRHFAFTTSYALFLSRFDASYLPYVYVGFALLVPLAGLIFARLSLRYRYAKVLLGALSALFVSLVIAWLVLTLSSARWPSMAFAIWYWPLSILSVVVFWGVAGQIFDVRQGKRLFGLISAGDSVASILGGLSIPLLVGAIGTVNLILVAILSFGVAMAVLSMLNRTFADKLDVVLTTEPSRREQPGQNESLFQNRYVSMILGMVVVSVISYFFLDNIFFSLAEAQFTTDEQLASFLGIFSAIIGFTTLLSQLFVSGFFLTRYGVRAGIVALPAVVVVGLTLTVLTEVAVGTVVALFSLTAITKILDRGLRDSVDRSSLQTLYQPFSAAHRAQIITTVNGIVEPIAAGIAGLGLLVLTSLFALDPVQLAYPALILAIAWLLISYAAGSEYPAILVAALRKRKLSQADLSLHDSSSLAVVKHAVNDPNPAVALHALHLLESVEDGSLALLLPTLLQHPAPEVRSAALERIESRGETDTVCACAPARPDCR
ncbi:MAG: hypothetical protein HC802_00655 [Caldilineaceae bacterium]|nr:hypothetical protein [Caldilineaceae bacterium]